jgi:hypothetical protein
MLNFACSLRHSALKHLHPLVRSIRTKRHHRSIATRLKPRYSLHIQLHILLEDLKQQFATRRVRLAIVF